MAEKLTNGHAAGSNGPRQHTFTPGTGQYQAFDVGYREGLKDFGAEQASGASALASEAPKADGRKGRVMSEDQKLAMKRGRDRARAAKEAAAQA